MSERGKTWLQVIGMAVPVILFIITLILITPLRELTAQINGHETRISVLEKSDESIVNQMERVEKKIDQLIEMHLEVKK